MTDIFIVGSVALLYWAVLLIGGTYLVAGISGAKKAFEDNTEWWLRILMLCGSLLGMLAGVLFLISPTVTHGTPGFIGTLLGVVLAMGIGRDTT